MGMLTIFPQLATMLPVMKVNIPMKFFLLYPLLLSIMIMGVEEPIPHPVHPSMILMGME